MQYFQKKKLRTQYTTAASSSPSSAGITDQSIAAAYYHQQHAAVLAAAMGNQQGLPQQLSAANPPGATPSAGGNSGALDLKMRKETTKVSAAGREMQANLSGLDLKNSLPQAYGFGVPPSTSSLHGYHAAGAEELLEKRATVAPTVTSNSLLMSQHHGSQAQHLMPQNVLMAAAAVAQQQQQHQQQQQQQQHQKHQAQQQQQQQQHLRNVSAAMSRSGQSNFPLVASQSPHANPPPPPPPPTSAGVFPHPVASTYLNNPLLQQHVASAGSQAAAAAAHAAASARYPQRGSLFDQQQQQQLMTMLAHHPNFMSYLQGDVSKSLEISENYNKTFKDRYSTINAPPDWYGSLLTGAPYSANNPLGAPGVIPSMAQTPHASPQAAPQHSPVGAARHHLRAEEEARLVGRSSAVKDTERSLQHKERHEKSLSQTSGRRAEDRHQPGATAIPPGQPHHHHPPPSASHHSSVAASVAPVLQDSTAAAVDQHFSKSLKLISQRNQQQQPSTTRACLTNAMVASSSTPTSTSASAVPQPAHHQTPQPIISQPVVSQPLPSLPPQHRSASVSAASLPRTSSNSQSQPRRPSESSGNGNNANLPQLIFSQLARDSSNASARTTAASLSSALPQVSHTSSSSSTNSSNVVSIGQALNTMLDLTVRQSMGGVTPMDEDGNSQSAARRILSALGSSASGVENRRSSPPNHQRQQPTPTTQQHQNSVPPALTPMRPVEGNSASSNSPPGSLASSLSHAGTPGGVTVSAGTATWTAPSMEAGEISVSPAPSEDTTTFVKYRGGTKKAWLKQFHTVDTRTSEQVVDGATDSVSSMSRDEAPSSSASNTSVSPPLGSLPIGHKTAALDPPTKMKLEPLEITAPTTDDSRSKPRRGMKRRRGAGSVSPSASTGSMPNGINGLVKPEAGHTTANTKSPTRKRKRRGAAGGVSGGSEESSEDRGDSASNVGSGNCVGGNNGMEKGPWRPESILQAPPNYSLLACKAMNKSELDRYRESLAAFVQWQSCSEAAPKQVKCRECRLSSKNCNNETSSGRSSNKAGLSSSPASPSTRNGSNGGGGPNAIGSSNIFCRFYAFRRLRFNRKGVLTTFGFSDGNDARPEDVSLWLPHYPLVNMGLDRQSASYLLRFVGDNFISLVEQERYAKENVRPSGNNGVTDIAWKRAVSRVREMCDVCDTTLFNMHWTCNKCGYAVCLDCFKYRQPRFIEKANGESKQVKVKNYSNEHEWLSCSASRQAHDPDKLMLTEIIPGNALWLLERAISELRPQWLSRVPSSLSPLADGHPASSASSTSSVPGAQSTGQRYNSDSPDALSVLADVATASDATSESAAGGPPPLSPLHLKHYTPRRGLQPAILGRERPVRCRTLEESRRAYPDVEHSWLCDGRLLRLHEAPPREESINGQHVRLFQEQWQLGQPILVSNCCRCFNPVLWNPKAFSKAFGSTKAVLMNCKTGVELVGNPMKVFWDGFECMKKRLKTASGDPMVLKLKDWPPGDDFCDILPDRYADLMSGLPLPQYTSRSGSLNLASRLPEFFVRPDLGPKMYNAYGLAREAKMATTNLHLDMADAVNVLLYVGVPEEMGESEAADVSKALRDARLDEATRERLKENAANVLPGALWHLFDACDADKIRDFLNKVAKERGLKIDPDHDPIHDQSWYLDQGLLERLREEYSVEGYTIVQCLGDAIFIPAGAPHQVRNLHSCIKVAEDFVSPENVHHCLKLTHEFRLLSSQHANHEDKLQVKNMLYHAIKDAVAVMLASKGLKEEEPPTS